MKTIIKTTFIVVLIISAFSSCKKANEEDELHIDFKTGMGYTSADATIADGTSVKIGIEAGTEKKKDPIIKFTISESVNGKADDILYTEDMEETEYEHDYNFTFSDTVSGSIHTYTFTITNRDGISEHETLTLTAQ